MKKGSIVSLVFSCILFVLGAALTIASFRHALAPVSIQHYAEGFSMRLSINNLSLATSSISLMSLILGCTLIISSFMLLILTFLLHNSVREDGADTISTNKVADKEETKKEEIQPEKPQKESVKAVDNSLEDKKEEIQPDKPQNESVKAVDNSLEDKKEHSPIQ